MAAPPAEKKCEESEDWITTFADAITLLMAFFVMMLTFAEFDMPAYEEAVAAMKENIGGRDEPSKTQQLKLDAEDVVFEMQADQVMSVSQDKKGVVIELSSNAFFKPGSAEFREAAIPVLEKMAQTLDAPKYQFYNIEIEGHTDDDPISSQRFPSNWELAAVRASGVVRFMIGQKLDPIRFRVVSFGETQPKVPNRDEAGKPIKENQATNRRINMRLSPMSLDDRARYSKKAELKSMLKDVGHTEKMEKDAGGSEQPPADKAQ